MSKKNGRYPIFRIDPDYEPPARESRELFGITLEQERNNFVPNNTFFTQTVTKRTKLSSAARRDLTVATITAKYTQSNSVCLAIDGQVIGNGAGQQSRIQCVRLAASKADNWFLRQHPRVREMTFCPKLKRQDKINAVDTFLQGESNPAETNAWRANFVTLPKRLETDEIGEWLDNLQSVALSSDAFFPFRDNLDRAHRSGVEYVVQAGGSLRDDQIIATADEYGMVMINSGVRLFHH